MSNVLTFTREDPLLSYNTAKFYMNLSEKPRLLTKCYKQQVKTEILE